MENRKFTEQEGIDVINNMIQATKFKMTKGFGNTYLLMGYSNFIISMLVLATLMHSNYNHWAHLLWGLLAIPIGIIFYRSSKEKKKANTYIDNAITAVWAVIWVAFIAGIATFTFAGNFSNMGILLSLVVILCSVGVMINGFILKEIILTFPSTCGMVYGFLMLNIYTTNDFNIVEMFIFFSISCIVIMIIPGHILNMKVKRSLKKGKNE